jgi:L-iditol 2-dehydrogenase
MLEKMNAIVMEGPGDYGLRQVPVPKPGYKEVLVKIKAVSICGSDPKVFSGGYMSINWPPSFPFIPGHEFSGEVAALGEGVTEFAIGDRVAGEAHNGCGSCENCKKGLYNLCLSYGKAETGHRHYGFTWQGAYADYNAYNVKALAKIPDGISFDEASLTDTAGTALQAARLTGILPGGFSLVIGPGPIGIFVMQIAKAMGGKTIMVGRNERLALAKELGADYTVNYEQCGDIVARVREITGGTGVDQAFECAGSDASIAQCVRSARKDGKVALVALPATDEHPVPTKTLVMNQIRLIGSRANPNCSKDVLELMSSGKINAKDMITHVFPLQEMKRAMKTFVERLDGAMKVVVHPNEST